MLYFVTSKYFVNCKTRGIDNFILFGDWCFSGVCAFDMLTEDCKIGFYLHEGCVVQTRLGVGNLGCDEEQVYQEGGIRLPEEPASILYSVFIIVASVLSLCWIHVPHSQTQGLLCVISRVLYLTPLGFPYMPRVKIKH